MKQIAETNQQNKDDQVEQNDSDRTPNSVGGSPKNSAPPATPSAPPPNRQPPRKNWVPTTAIVSNSFRRGGSIKPSIYKALFPHDPSKRK